MTDEKITLETEFEEPEYIIPPHPEGVTVLCEDVIFPEEPIAAEASLPDLIQQTVDELRGELRTELQNELKGAEINAKN